MLHPTEAGVPQGGVISPWLLNVALHGMEQALGILYTPKDVRLGTYALVRYDVAILCRTHGDQALTQPTGHLWGSRGGGARLSYLKDRIDCSGGR
jgi:RNA-directed DNA polymerase